jgi:hypothetical protein
MVTNEPFGKKQKSANSGKISSEDILWWNEVPNSILQAVIVTSYSFPYRNS